MDRIPMSIPKKQVKNPANYYKAQEDARIKKEKKREGREEKIKIFYLNPDRLKGQWRRLIAEYEEYASACAYCDRTFDVYYITWDHLTPRSEGGDHRFSNGVLACGLCNSELKSASREERLRLMKPEWRAHVQMFEDLARIEGGEPSKSGMETYRL